MAQNTEGGTRSADYQRRLAEGSGNVDPQGNFSIQVLKAALQQTYGLALAGLSDELLQRETQNADITDFDGFVCHQSSHWFAIRQIGGRFWNLNSTLERPVTISHFQLATEMLQWRHQGYTIFCVPRGLPEAGQKVGTGGNWHKMSDLLQGRSTEKDPWESLTGQGMRLDGGGGGGTSNNLSSLEGLTEEEQIQLALQQSLEPVPSQAPVVSPVAVPVPDEPPKGASNTTRIQFRMPDGSKKVRSFFRTDLVDGVEAYCREESGSSVELRFGFPPKTIDSLRGKTIDEAGMANESVQVRSV